MVAFFSRPRNVRRSEARSPSSSTVRALWDEHAARSAGRVEDGAGIGVEDMGDQGDQRDGGEELSAIVGFLAGELGEEVLIDPAEDIARDLLEFIGVELAEEVSEDFVVEFLVVALGQHTS